MQGKTNQENYEDSVTALRGLSLKELLEELRWCERHAGALHAWVLPAVRAVYAEKTAGGVR